MSKRSKLRDKHKKIRLVSCNIVTSLPRLRISQCHSIMKVHLKSFKDPIKVSGDVVD